MNPGRLTRAQFWEMAKHAGIWFALKQLLGIGMPRAYYVPAKPKQFDDPEWRARALKVLYDKPSPSKEE